MRRLLAMIGVLLLLTGVAARPAWGAGWVETGDAGDLPRNAQQPSGVGTLDSIAGALGGNADEDVYRICLTGTRTFSATTVGQPGIIVDTQLFLFSSSGAGIYANDDDPSSGDSRSTLPANNPLTPPNPGVYYLAVSAFNNDPLDQADQPIFGDGFGVVGPTDADPVGRWSDVGGEAGDYAVALTGATICTPSAVCAALPPVAGAPILGTDGDDRLAGTPGADLIMAGDGADEIAGMGGNDIIVGGMGNDRIEGGDGDDIICGGAGNDQLSGGAGDDVIAGDDGDDRLLGGPGDDTLGGGANGDRLAGGPGTNINDGGSGNDVCVEPSPGFDCSP